MQNSEPRRIVVKVGTTTLTDSHGRIDQGIVRSLAEQMSSQVNSGVQCVFVTSGAIRAGMERLRLRVRPRTIPEKQAAAAVGQGILLHTYSQMFSEAGITAAQVLLTRNDFADRTHYLNARNTLNSLLTLGCLPVINENDTTAVDEIKFGDNDTLAALVAAALNADLLIVLSDVSGLYDGDPSNGDNKIIPVVKKITDEIRAIAGGAVSGSGTGGMKTKIDAAEIAVSSGVDMVIARGRDEDVIAKVVRGEPLGTRFLAGGSRLSHKKRWIAFSSPIRGTVQVNEGACKVVVSGGKSLLPAGITGVTGTFRAGDLIALCDSSGTRFARGFANYSAEEIQRIMGCKTAEIEDALGHKDFDEVVHRDNLVLGV